jgi:hypothetical protein
MNAKNFRQLLQGVREAGQIVGGDRAPARETVVDATIVHLEHKAAAVKGISRRVRRIAPREKNLASVCRAKATDLP